MFLCHRKVYEAKGQCREKYRRCYKCYLSLPVVTRKRRNPTVPTVVSKPKRPQLFVSGGGSRSVAVRNPYDVL